MQIAQRARNVFRAILQSYGTVGMKRALWNAEFSNGRWKCLDDTAGDCVYAFIEKYALTGSILDLGCGSGSTANEVSLVYTRYTGVDVSDVAIEQAVQKSAANGRQDRTDFVRADITAFEPGAAYDVILFRDSMYYIPPHRVLPMLKRYRTYLRNRGVFVVRLWGSEKNRNIVSLIENHFAVIEKYTQEEPKALIVVFR